MHKSIRLSEIEKILDEETITSQEALLKKLEGRGIFCTQATLSRNLRQLGVSRIRDGNGNYRYSIISNRKVVADPGLKLNIISVVTDLIEANGMMVIRTIPGNANSTAYYIDNAGRREIAGTIAGDDTILVIPRSGITPGEFHRCLEAILPGLHRQTGREEEKEN